MDRSHCSHSAESLIDKFSLFSSSSDKTVKVWDAGSRQCVQTFYEHNDQVYTNLGWYIFAKGERGLCFV